jgi:hypothetical protein
LAFTAGKPQSTLADHGVIAFWQTHDEVMRQSGFSGFNHGFLGNVRLTVSHVVAHCVVKENGLLRYHADLSAERGQSNVANIVAIDHNGP